MVMIQIRNVPEETHRTLKARAAKKGMSLSDYLLREIESIARMPTVEELTERIRARGLPRPSFDSAAIIREMRDEG